MAQVGSVTAGLRSLAAGGLRSVAAAGPGAARRATRWQGRLPASWHAGQEVTTRVQGFRLSLALDDNVQRELYYLGAYERPFVRYLVDEVRPGDVVLDVGAHVGIFTLALARRLDELGAGRVISVEAASGTADRLRAHVAVNGLDDHVTVLQAALTAEDTMVELRGDPMFGTGDVAVTSAHGTGEVVETVPGRALDGWAAEHDLERLDVVKMDIEGAEHAALLGMRGTLESLRPRLVTVECKGYVLDRAGTTEAAIDELMVELGYRRQPPLSRMLGLRGGLPHVDDNVLYRSGASTDS